MMTTNRTKILAAIADCNRYIAKEGARSADLRPAEIQKLLDWYISHLAQLLAMLDDEPQADGLNEVIAEKLMDRMLGL